MSCCEDSGGLGIKNFDKFGSALRLRWFSHNLDSPLENASKCHDKTGAQLFFFASTHITVEIFSSYNFFYHIVPQNCDSIQQDLKEQESTTK